jgi:hypothetical protein
MNYLNRVIVACGCILASGASATFGGMQGGSTRSATVTASVIETSPTVLTYSYTIASDKSNTGEIWTVSLDISKPAGSADVGRDGIDNGPGFLASASALALNNGKASPMIPVGLSAPNAWTAGLSVSGNAVWSADDGYLIQPGQSQAGFKLTTHGLPTIRKMALQPWIDIDTAAITPPNGTREDILRYKKDVEKLEASVGAVLNTIGPTAPPTNFNPVLFLQNIRNLGEQAFALGWFKDTGLWNSLQVKLNASEAALARGNIQPAKNSLMALVNEVNAQAGKGLSAEAAAALRFNTLYLINKIS